MPEEPAITVTMTVSQLLSIPFDGAIYMIRFAGATCSREFLQASYDAERAGKARWPVMNHLREALKR